MKKALLALLATLSFNALSLDAVTVLRPSPLGVVIAVNTYFKDSKKVYYIRVESQSRDFEQAKKQAFRLASEQVAGTVVLSESELRNSRLTRDEIITYSSGLIDEYKIVDRFDGPDFVKLTMDVWITESVMAQRLLAKSATERGVDGVNLSVRVDSILDERRRKDKIFQTILQDYPRRAFRVKAQQPLIQMDPYRNTTISVDWEINWDERFFNAFYDAARQTGRKPCVLWGCPETPTFQIQNWEFDDVQLLRMIADHIRGVSTTVMTELQDINGQAVSRTCENLGNISSLFIVGRQHIALNVKNPVRGRATLRIGQNVSAMSNMENIRIEVVPDSQCRPL